MKKLYNTGKLLTNISDVVPALVAVYNIRTGVYVYVNKSVTKLLGYTPRDFISGGYTFAASLVHPEDMPRIMEENKKALRLANSKNHAPDKESIANFEYRMKHKDGRWIWLHTDGSVYGRDDDGKVEYILSTSLDITRRKEAEEELKRYAEEKKNYAQTLTENIVDAVIVTDQNFIIQSWNKGAENLYGWKAEEVIGMPTSILDTEFVTETKERSVKKVQKTGHWRGEVIQRRKNGTTVPVSASVAYVMNGQGEKAGLISVNTDITERKVQERRKDDFIALVSHELKTPVTSLKIYAQVLESRFRKKGDSESVGYFSKMDKQLSKLTDLVNRLLDVPRIQEGKIRIIKETFALNSLINETIENVQRVTDGHKIIFNKKKGGMIYADKNRVEQVLINLLNNAVKYSPKADKVIVDVEMNKNYMLVSIQDYGLGISKEQQDAIFGRFYQIENEARNTYPGLGVGLYVSKEIIDRHKGKIWVESEEGKGSTFFFTLPTSKEDLRSKM